MTLYLLPTELISRVQPLFTKQMAHHPFCAGVITGKYPGQVIVDNLEQPRSALVVKGGLWCYLGGEANNLAFNQALGAALAAKQFVGEDAWGLLFNGPTDDWRQVLSTLIAERRPITTPRVLYVATADHVNAPAPIPDGFSLHFIDAALPAIVQGPLPEAVQSVLDLRATSQPPDQMAFGYVALQDRTCVAWAMVDCIVGAHGEIGLETRLAYQRRGLGLATSGATLRYGLAHGLATIHWDVVSYNRPSIRMADKHGLQLSLAYDQHLLIFGQTSYLANLAWDHLDRNRFQAVLEVCETLLELADGQRHGHFLSGAAWAGLGHQDKAFFHLHKTLEHGWDSLAELENCAPLTSLHGSPEWEGLLARLKSNIALSATVMPPAD